MCYIGLLYMFCSGLFCGVVLSIAIARYGREPEPVEIDAHERLTWPGERGR